MNLLGPGMNRRALLTLGAVAAPLVIALNRVLAQGATRLEISVLNGDAPVAGAPVNVESATLRDGEVSIVTDADGVARLDLESDGLYDVRVETSEFQSALLRDIRVIVGETTSVTLTLIPRRGSY